MAVASWEDWDFYWGIPPVIDVQPGSPDVGRVSEHPGHDTATVVWRSNVPLEEWAVEVVPDAGSDHDAGVVIPTAAGSVNTADTGFLDEDTDAVTVIKGTDLKSADPPDGVKIVKVFGKSLASEWSD